MTLPARSRPRIAAFRDFVCEEMARGEAAPAKQRRG